MLFPILRHNTEILPFLLSWISYNQHGFGFVIILGEAALNRVDADLVLCSGLVGLWQMIYAGWVIVHHFTDESGKPLYPIMDLNSPKVGLWFLVLYALHWMYCYLAQGILWRIRRLQQPKTKERVD